MADDESDGDDENADVSRCIKGFDTSKLKILTEAPSQMDDRLRQITRDAEPPTRAFRDLHENITSQTKSFASAQETIKKSIEPFRDLQDRMNKLGLAAGADSPFKRLADQIGAQQSAVEALRVPKLDTPRNPKIPSLPPNPTLETNKRLEQIEKRFEQMQSVATNAAEIATGLQGAAAEFLQKFEKAATENDHAARLAIRIGVFAVFIAVAMPAAQIIYSEYRREPSNEAEIQAALEAVQVELSAMRGAHAIASKRLNAALATSDSETVTILREIYDVLAKEAASPQPAIDSQ